MRGQVCSQGPRECWSEEQEHELGVVAAAWMLPICVPICVGGPGFPCYETVEFWLHWKMENMDSIDPKPKDATLSCPHGVLMLNIQWGPHVGQLAEWLSSGCQLSRTELCPPSLLTQVLKP